MEGNEVLYTRQIIQKLHPEKWPQFFVPWNISINCRFFHSTYGHRTSFRDWFLQRMIGIYGLDVLDAWNDDLPLKDGSKIRIGE
jgi:hypothetical protein